MISPERQIQTVVRVIRPRAGDPREEAADGGCGRNHEPKGSQPSVHFKVQAICSPRSTTGYRYSRSPKSSGSQARRLLKLMSTT